MDVEKRIEDGIYIEISKGLANTNSRIVAIKIYAIFTGVDTDFEVAEKILEYAKSLKNDHFKLQYVCRERPIIIDGSLEACSSAFIYANDERQGY